MDQFGKAYEGLKVTKKLKGGESVGLQMMENYFKDKKRVAEFKKPMTRPTAIEPDTTVLSPYLKFGCLSVRNFYWKLKDLY